MRRAPAGSLRFAFWDHWVPGANGALQQLAQRWGERNRVNMTLDFINTTGNQLQLTIAAQAQSRSGHDGISLLPWDPGTYADQLEPCDDVMGRLSRSTARSTRSPNSWPSASGAWRGVPATSGTQTKPACVRFDLLQQHAGHRHPRHVAGRATSAARAPTPGPGTPSCARPRPATAPACPSACRWASSPTRWTGSARCSSPMARASPTSAATRPSAATRNCARRSTTRCGCRASCRTTSGRGTTRRTTAR